jgi:hypothetical protein
LIIGRAFGGLLTLLVLFPSAPTAVAGGLFDSGPVNQNAPHDLRCSRETSKPSSAAEILTGADPKPAGGNCSGTDTALNSGSI